MSNISNALINSKGSFYTPLNLKKDDKGNITSLAFDLNNNGQVDENETVADSNKDGQITPNEILDFIVNNVQQIPQIEFARKVIIDSKSTTDSDAFFTQYNIKLTYCKSIIGIYAEVQTLLSSPTLRAMDRPAIWNEGIAKIDEILKAAGMPSHPLKEDLIKKRDSFIDLLNIDY